MDNEEQAMKYEAVMDAVYDVLMEAMSNEFCFNPSTYIIPAADLAELRRAYIEAGGEM